MKRAGGVRCLCVRCLVCSQFFDIFKLFHFPRLVQIAYMTKFCRDLSNNLLSTLHSDTFMTLQSLRTLRLSRNKIETIEKGAFQGLFALRLL